MKENCKSYIIKTTLFSIRCTNGQKWWWRLHGNYISYNMKVIHQIEKEKAHKEFYTIICLSGQTKVNNL